MSNTIINNARTLRKNLTLAEKKLWQAIRYRQLQGFKFRRQVPLGNYIADFLCFESRLIVEVDGGQHYQNNYDAQRTVWLEKHNFRVLRFWNNEVLSNLDAVKEIILTHCVNKHPPS